MFERINSVNQFYNQNLTTMAIKTVFVSLQGMGNSTQLRLRDSDNNDAPDGDLTTGVDVNNVIQWKVDSNPPNGARPIHSIERVYIKDDPDNAEILTKNPTNIGGGVWEGKVVSTSPGKGKKQKYNIDFKRTASDNTHIHDPKLQMN